MIDKEDFKYCELNKASRKVFPTYFLLDLKLSTEQKQILSKLITFLRNVVKSHTPPPPKTCPTCGQTVFPFFADTWLITEHIDLVRIADLLEKLLEPNRWSGNHT